MRRLLIVMALVAATVVGAAPSGAQEGLGDGFQSFGLTAVSGGQRVIADSLADQPPGTAQAGIPEAEATMTKSTGHALASVAWPSALAGNAGVLLFLLGPVPCTPGLPELFPGQPQPPSQCSPVPIPPEVMAQYHYLNTPVRAEALNPVRPAQDNSVPGATMSARANDVEVAADAILGGFLATDIERFGTTRATSVVKLTGAAGAVADARSIVNDIDLVAGEVTIGSVTSVAHGETDGKTAKSSGATTVGDMKVHGIPVTVDGTGVHVSGNTADAVGPAAAVVNQVLAGFGMTMYVTRPTQKIDGATTTFDAGSLIIDWVPPGAPGGVTIEFGAAHVTASATLPFQVDIDLPVDLPSVSGALESLPDLGVPSTLPPLSATGSGGPTLDLQPASLPSALPDGLEGWLVFLGLAATLAVAAALRRLPDRVLDAATAQCETGEDA